MTQEEYVTWRTECIRDNICTYHREKNCGCYYWTCIKIDNAIVDPNTGLDC